MFDETATTVEPGVYATPIKSGVIPTGDTVSYTPIRPAMTPAGDPVLGTAIKETPFYSDNHLGLNTTRIEPNGKIGGLGSTPVKPGYRPTSNSSWDYLNDDLAKTSSFTPVEPGVWTTGETKTIREPVQVNELVGWQNHLPEKTYHDLISAAQHLDEHQIGQAFDKDNPLLTRSKPGVNIAKRQAGAIKNMAYQDDPVYGARQKSYSQFKKDADLVGNILEPGKMESVVTNLFSKNKNAAQEAAANVFPNAYEGPIQDIAANKAYEEIPTKVGLSKSQMIRAALSAGVGGGAQLMHQNPVESGALAAATMMLTEPQLYKYALSRGSQLATPAWGFLERNASRAAPLMIRDEVTHQSLQDDADKAKAYMNQGWSLLDKKEKKK
jgi:hypothetical protein